MVFKDLLKRAMVQTAPKRYENGSWSKANHDRIHPTMNHGSVRKSPNMDFGPCKKPLIERLFPITQ